MLRQHGTAVETNGALPFLGFRWHTGKPQKAMVNRNKSAVDE